MKNLLDWTKLRDRAWKSRNVFRRNIDHANLGGYRYDCPHRRAVKDSFVRTHFPEESPILEGPLLIIAFTNRCGSNLLCNLLEKTGRTGRIGENLNAKAIRKATTQHDIKAFPDYISNMARRAEMSGLHFGLKASHNQIAMLHEFGILNMFPGVRVVHVYRNDAIAQAVSHSIAAQTKQWTSRQKKQDVVPSYRFGDIKSKMNNALAGNRGIVEICSLLHLPKLDVCYEDFQVRPRRDIIRVLDFIGEDANDLRPLRPDLKRQSSARNQEYCKRFRAEFLADVF